MSCWTWLFVKLSRSSTGSSIITAHWSRTCKVREMLIISSVPLHQSCFNSLAQEILARHVENRILDSIVSICKHRELDKGVIIKNIKKLYSFILPTIPWSTCILLYDDTMPRIVELSDCSVNCRVNTIDVLSSLLIYYYTLEVQFGSIPEWCHPVYLY